MSKKVVGDLSTIVLVETIEVNEELSYEEVPVSILDRQVRKLRNKEIASVKVLWQNQQVEESTWEAEEDKKKKYPHLFIEVAKRLEILQEFKVNSIEVLDVAKGEVDPDYAVWFERRSCANNEPEPEPEPERPAKRPHVQAFDDKAQEAEGQRRRLVQENEALQAQIQKTKIAVENPAKSEKDEKLIDSLRRKVCDYGFDLEKTEGELEKARARLAKNAEGRASFVRQLKEKYDKEIMGLEKKINTLESELTKQARDYKAKREHCYALMSQLEENLQQLQEENHTTTRVLEARSQLIGWLLQEKSIIRERVRMIADYIVMKCNECEDMNRSMFFATVMIFVRQIMDELYRLQEDMARRPAAGSTNSSRAPGAAVEALMYS
ncbi:gamma tubulin complex adapter mto1-like [Nicotiana sylvestris]|uniref:gamma tubulin complex adapter mto1-like n=1 Tax=Nicotiana sylvestris TaxID=4096 RepID=UPI00388CC9FB